jgi:hypothetical protein
MATSGSPGSRPVITAVDDRLRSSFPCSQGDVPPVPATLAQAPARLVAGASFEISDEPACDPTSLHSSARPRQSGRVPYHHHDRRFARLWAVWSRTRVRRPRGFSRAPSRSPGFPDPLRPRREGLSQFRAHVQG